jgi:hypothetical protein
MRNYFLLAIVAGLACAPSLPTPADEQPGTGAVLDKAIQALGGQDKLSKVKAATWNARGKITIDGKEHPFTADFALQGLHQYREEYATELLDRKAKEVAVLYGDKGYRNIADLSSDLDAQGIADLKRTIYLVIIPATIVPLKDKSYKLETLAEEKVGDRPAAVIKVTPPDGKDFRLYFDKESGLPVKLVARIVAVGGGEFTHETTYAGYKDFGGIKKATKITTKRDGAKFMEQEITDFQVVNRLDENAFLK